MVNQIIDAIIDNYDRKLTATRKELTRKSDTLNLGSKLHKRVDDANIELRKANATLQRDLSAAQLDKLRTMDHLIAAVAFIPGPMGDYGTSASPNGLRDALYAIPANAVTTYEQARIDALMKALDKEEVPG